MEPTLVATDYVNINEIWLFYKLTPGTQYFTISKVDNDWNKESELTWDNAEQ